MVSVLRRALKKLSGGFTSLFIDYGVSHDWPLLVAVAWRIAMAKNGRVKCRNSGRRKLVVLSKSGGVEDIEAAYLGNPAPYAVFFMPRAILKKSGEFFLKDSVSDVDYGLQDFGLEEAKARYRRHLSQVLIWFQRLFGLSAVVQFNVVYWAERELSSACVNQGIRFVTVHKESAWAPNEIASRIKFFEESVGPVDRSAIAVYNDVTKDIFRSAGCAEPERVYVTGCPRLDVSHRLRGKLSVPGKKTVLFYLIEPQAGMGRFKDPATGDWHRGVPMPDGSIGDWSRMATAVNEAVMGLAADHPDIQFVFKGKTGFSDQQEKALLRGTKATTLPKNVTLISGGIGHHLLETASVVIGFNTTAVLEAMAAGVPVIVPNIFSDQENELAGFAHDINDGALVATTQEELRSMILGSMKDHAEQKELSEGQEKALIRMMGNPDGQSGQRLRDLLDRAVLNDL